MKVGRKIHCLAVGMAAVAMFAIIGASPAMAKPTSQTSAPCPGPKGIQGLQTDNNVGASFTNNGSVSSYKFSSNDQNAVNGVPGLIKYCVYPTGASHAPTVHVDAQGGQAENIQWTKTTSSKSPYNFSFQRPGGNATNIWFDENGETTSMGTANWGNDVPDSQKIVLHVADPSLCNTDSGTCFVKPNPGPICNAGDNGANVAYNAIPTDFLNGCPGPASYGFEAQQASEFGDAVTLATGGALQSLTVDFQSYGCGTSGHWNTAPADPCMTTGTPTFQVPDGITARLYQTDPSGTTVGSLLATATANPNIPYRPSADPTCTGADVGKWFNSVRGKCVNSISKLVTFNNWQDAGGQSVNVAAGDNVIWTVAFKTTDYGIPAPIGVQDPGCNSNNNNPGCGYDSLNVGTQKYGPDAFAGIDLLNDPGDGINALTNRGNTSSAGNLTPIGSGNPGLDPSPGNRPLGEIVTGP